MASKGESREALIDIINRFSELLDLILAKPRTCNVSRIRGEMYLLGVILLCVIVVVCALVEVHYGIAFLSHQRIMGY